ncbi:HdeD family acid-resistance protein [Elioraea sp.]|jgi:uncharacterized membrane protein HdeD (DUF308 family)|uniref:HdeD family acid-resistance protein n=1 Tax=Elioraea sp. TaxID=2185103 RepID=UPI0021DB8CC7|nr:HdeD family acid-resistance protein [Elioraea sp.]GIX12008.1 MAG: hypothetical protein KatS3mg116_3718 [Elioraea sp.]
MAQIDLSTAAAVFSEAMRENVRRHRLLLLVQGGLMIAAGAAAILFPILASVAFAWLLGWLLIAIGLVQSISLLSARHHPSFWLQLIPAVLGVTVGVLLLRNLGPGLLVIALLLIVFLLVDGLARIVFALTVRPLENWIWVLASGLLGVVLAAVLFASMPVTALWLIGLLLGIHLVAEGTALVALVWTIRRSG